MIDIQQLQYQYRGAPTASLRNINLQIKKQSLFGLLGPNGAGKTTLLSIISGLLTCSTGRVTIEQHDINQHRQLWKKKISLVPQEYAFYNRLSVAENLRFFSSLHSLPSHKRTSHIAEAIKVTQLENHSNCLDNTLSGGLKRRLNLAIGLLNKPQLLLLDEPTTGIDPHSRHFILETIRRLNQEGTTILYTSHYMDEIESLCDEIAIIDDGKILLQGTLNELLIGSKKTSLQLLLTTPISNTQHQALQAKANWPYTLTRNHQQLEFHTDNIESIILILQSLTQLNIQVEQIHYGTDSLEELFLNLTQRQLRD